MTSARTAASRWMPAIQTSLWAPDSRLARPQGCSRGSVRFFGALIAGRPRPHRSRRNSQTGSFALPETDRMFPAALVRYSSAWYSPRAIRYSLA